MEQGFNLLYPEELLLSKPEVASWAGSFVLSGAPFHKAAWKKDSFLLPGFLCEDAVKK